MRYSFRFYTPDEGQFAVHCSAVNDHVAELVGEIRDTQSDMPICYVHSHVLGNKVTAALNAQDERLQTLYPHRYDV